MSEKMQIVRVGTVDADGSPHDWEFDGHGKGTGLDCAHDPPLIAGYTIAELREIAERAATPEPSESARELAKSAILESYSWDHQNGSSFQRLDRDVLEDEVTKAISAAAASARREGDAAYIQGYASGLNEGVRRAAEIGDRLEQEYDTGDPTFDSGQQAAITDYQNAIRKLIAP